MKNIFLRKFLSFLLVLLMVFTFLPTTVSANEGIPDEASEADLYQWDESDTLSLTGTEQEKGPEQQTVVSELLASISAFYRKTDDDWAAVAMAAYGKADEVAGAQIIKNARQVYENGSVTDLERTIITLTSLGVNASKVYGGNEGVYLDFIAKLGSKTISTLNEAIFGLLALDSGDYSDSGLNLNRQACIDFLLDKKQTVANGQYAWVISGNTPDIDLTAMAISALAPYYDRNEEIKTAIAGALRYLADQQNDAGHYGNSNSTAMVIIALVTLGEDPNANTGDFTKSGRSLLDGLLAFKTDSNRFGFDNNSNPSTLSTEQGFRALVAYWRYLTSGNKAFNIYNFGPQTGDGTALTGETDPSVTPTEPSAPKNITVRVEDLYHGTTLIPETRVTLSGTHLDALKAALIANDKNPDADLTELSGYVSSILGVSVGASTGWMYAINGEIPVTSLNETQVAEGDSLILFYIDWYDTVYFTKFDRTKVSINEGESVTLQLSGINFWEAMGGSGKYEPIAGATVYAQDISGNKVGTDVVTGSDGRATLTFSSAGTYVISAIRRGAINSTDLLPPLCVVTVSTSTPPTPVKTITVYFTLQGLSSRGKEETWISKKAVELEEGATVADVIIKALEGTGYRQSAAQRGYIKSITTPSGFTLSEKHDGMENSGWLYKVNSNLPTVGIDSYYVKNGDRVLLYFTKDYTKDPDAGKISGGADLSKEEGSVVSSVVKVTTVVKDGMAIATVSDRMIKNALEEVAKKLKDSTGKAASGEIQLCINNGIGTTSIETVLKSGSIREIAETKNIQLRLGSPVASLTLDSKTLAGLVKGVAKNTDVSIVMKRLNTDALTDAEKEIIGDSPVFDLSIMIEGKPVHELGGTATVFLPYTAPAGVDASKLTVYYLSATGEVIKMENTSYDAKSKGFVFTTTHFPIFFITDDVSTFVNPFEDVKESDWFYEAVSYVVSNDLMTGTASDKFSPNSPMTRAMFVTALYQYEGKPVVRGISSFTDVEKGQWYTDAINWATENGIVAGYSKDMFGINDKITREQLATILRNYAAKKGLDITKTTDLGRYLDKDDISSWALEALKWANATCLIQGRSSTTLAARKMTTRAEAAQVLMKFIENLMR